MFYAMFQNQTHRKRMLILMFKHHANKHIIRKSKWQESKRHRRFVDPVRWQTHILWRLPSQEGNPLV